MLALLERLTFVRAIALPRHLGDNIHPARLAKFAREGAVAPVNLLSDFGKRRRIASLAAQMLELETTLTDSAIALFERLTGRLFTRPRNSQDRSWSASKTQAGRLIRLFGGTIDAMVRACAHDRDLSHPASIPVLARPPSGFVFTKLAPSQGYGDREASHAPARRHLADPRRAWSTQTNQHVQRYHFVRAKLEAGSMDGAIVKVHSNGTGTPGGRVPGGTPSLEPVRCSSSARYRMTNNDPRPPFGSRYIAIASVCAVLAILAAHHPVASAQSVDGAVSPTVSQDAAANRRLKLDHATTPTALRIVLPLPDAAESRKSEVESRGNRPLQIGFPRSMPNRFQGDLSPQINWIPLDDGSIAGTVLLTSPGALAMRAGIRAELGAEGEIRFFAPNTAEGHSEQGRESRELPVITREDFHEGGEPEILWSPTVEGDTLAMEITLPSREALSAFSFRIEQVSHIYVSIGSLGFFWQNNLIATTTSTSSAGSGAFRATIRTRWDASDSWRAAAATPAPAPC